MGIVNTNLRSENNSGTAFCQQKLGDGYVITINDLYEMQ